MAKIPRVTAKIFASNAAPDDIGQYGSALTGTKVLTSDIAEIQALPAYETGWRGAVISNRNYPTLQETNGLQKTFSQQIAYTLQNGMPEWDEGTTYYINQFCRVANDFYYSLSDDNIGNNPKLDNTNWSLWAPGLDTYANQDLSNLTPAGEKHFINYGQATNCITEIPNRIHYTLVDGVLTILSGSVVIVPYGTEDLTEQYPVGSTFINDNLKVVDTQYALDPNDNISKFFVWIELISDISGDTATNADYSYFIELSNAASGASQVYSCYSGEEPSSPPSLSFWYDTTSNLVKRYIDGAWVSNFSLPWSHAQSSAVSQVFNGMGYIGSTVWIDKGVKAIVPNGRNSDTTYNTVPYITDKLYLANESDLPIGESQELALLTDGAIIRSRYFAVNDEGYLEQNNTNLTYEGFTFVRIMATQKQGAINQFIPYQTLRVADAQHYVKKTGDTMTGNLLVETSGHPFIGTVISNIAYNEAPAVSTTCGAFSTIDKNGQWMANFGVERYTDNHTQIKMQGYSHTGTSGRIQLISDPNTGAWRGQAPTPPAGSNTTDIATTAWICSNLASTNGALGKFSKATNGYFKFRNGVIIQWGLTGNVASNTGFTVTFPTAFTVAPQAVFVQYNVANNGNIVRVATTTTTTFRTAHDSFNTAKNPQSKIRWFAIGY